MVVVVPDDNSDEERCGADLNLSTDLVSCAIVLYADAHDASKWSLSYSRGIRPHMDPQLQVSEVL